MTEGTTGEPALELRGIRKRFGSVEALRGADFVLAPGEVHGLLGENGAGKSTLMHVAFGLTRADAGEMRVRGGVVRVRSPNDARALGIGMVHQHFTSIPTLSVAENLELAGRRAATSTDGPTEGRAARVREQLRVGLDGAALVEALTVGQQQRLEILKALGTDARILLLDEPTAVLAPAETEELLALLREFAAGGGSVVFISHKLNEVFAACDRVTVLRRGEVTLVGDLAEQSRQTLTAAMIGAGPPPDGGEPSRVPAEPGEVRASGPGFELRAGEIVGVAAVEGNGQREFLRRLAGLEDRPDGWTVADPVAFIPEDRTTEGLAPGFTLTENLVLGLRSDPRWIDGPWIRWRAARRRMGELLEEFAISAAGPGAPARSLSGGNQQKVVFARAVEGGPRVVVAEDPTRGLDLRAAAFVRRRLRRLAADGALVVVYSADLDEVLALASRVVVMYQGVLTPVPSAAGRAEVGSLMLGVGA